MATRASGGGPALLALGFRPFFLFAGLWAPIELGLSLAMIRGHVVLPTAFDAVAWHVHEMLFGYVAAVFAGFLLTAIPNWTGRLPLRGLPLLALAVPWLAGRAAVATSGLIGAWPAAVIDVAFLLALAAVALREIAAGRNWRNLPIVGAAVLLALCNALSHAELMGLVESDGLAARLAIAVMISLIGLVGGRIVPSFTRNWLVKRGAARLPAAFGRFDRLTVAVTAMALLTWAAAPESLAGALLAAAAAALNLARLGRWRGLATGAEPLLWVMHLGYLWIPLGLALLALSHWLAAVPQSGAVHALTAGAIATMTMAVMSRATLGHSGRPLHAGAGLTAAYLLLTLAVVTRIAAALWSALQAPLLTVAATAWIAAFLFFMAICGPMLVTRPPPPAGQ